MSCEAEQKAFEDKMADVQRELEAELKDIEIETERRAKEIESDFEAGNDLAAGVGAAAGTVIGGALGGPVGAGVGAVLGKTIGSLFVIEFSMHREKVVLDVPQVKMGMKTIKFDVPQVTVNDKDIIFGVPTVEMRREKGPPIPETVVIWENECIGGGWVPKVCTKVPKTTIRWKESWYDRPVMTVKQVKFIIGIPEVKMDTQDFSFGVPEFKNDATEFSFDVPSVSIRFIKDAGRKTAALAAALAQWAQEAALKKQLEFKDRMKSEVAPLAVAMFACHRKTLQSAWDTTAGQFDPEIAKLSASVSAIAGKGVTETDPEYVKTKQLLEEAIAARKAALKPLDDALTEFDANAKKTMDQFLTGGLDAAAMVTHGSAADEPEPSILNALVFFQTPEETTRILSH